MTPEELFRTLLYPRRQSPIGSVTDVSHPTRIRALQALREGDLNVPGLADRIDVNRQTAYRVIEPCSEAGLVRPVEARYTLSTSGSEVLRIYQHACDVGERDGLIQLSRSKHRPWVLQALQVAPARKAALTKKAHEEGGPSRTTVSRTVDRLADTGYIVKRSGSYSLTEPGQVLLETYTDFMQTIVQALDKRDFLRWLPADLNQFPVRALDGATFVQNTPSHPHNVLNALLRVADPSLETFEGIATIVSPTIAQAYRPLLEGDTQVTGVFPDEVLFGLHRDSEFIDYVRQQGFISYIREGLAARDAELLFVSETPPIHLAIYDGSRVIISLSPSTGVPDGEASAIDSTDPTVVEWATSFFETYRSNGRPPLRVFLDRSLGYGSTSQYQAGD